MRESALLVELLRPGFAVDHTVGIGLQFRHERLVIDVVVVAYDYRRSRLHRYGGWKERTLRHHDSWHRSAAFG